MLPAYTTVINLRPQISSRDSVRMCVHSSGGLNSAHMASTRPNNGWTRPPKALIRLTTSPHPPSSSPLTFRTDRKWLLPNDVSIHVSRAPLLHLVANPIPDHCSVEGLTQQTEQSVAHVRGECTLEIHFDAVLRVRLIPLGGDGADVFATSCWIAAGFDNVVPEFGECGRRGRSYAILEIASRVPSVSLDLAGRDPN